MQSKAHQTIRYGFESNSSSSHSLVLDTRFERDTTLDKVTHLRLVGGEFGWDWCIIDDAISKANYFAVYHQDDEEMLNLLQEVIKENTSVETVEMLFSDDDNSDYWSYIDHQSNKKEGKTLEKIISKKDIENFVFNKSSVLITGNDNSPPKPGVLDRFEQKGAKYIFTIDKTPFYLHTLEPYGQADETKAEAQFFRCPMQSIARYKAHNFDDYQWELENEVPKKTGKGTLVFRKRHFDRTERKWIYTGQPHTANYTIAKIS